MLFACLPHFSFNCTTNLISELVEGIRGGGSGRGCWHKVWPPLLTPLLSPPSPMPPTTSIGKPEAVVSGKWCFHTTHSHPHLQSSPAGSLMWWMSQWEIIRGVSAVAAKGGAEVPISGRCFRIWYPLQFGAVGLPSHERPLMPSHKVKPWPTSHVEGWLAYAHS